MKKETEIEFLKEKIEFNKRIHCIKVVEKYERELKKLTDSIKEDDKHR